MFSFLKIIAKLNKYTHILQYNENKEMQRKVEGFKVEMGFGLHQGWAIEGAIGSFFKIDASYLSPNVNMAARLEAATKQFETPFLLSGHLRDILSYPMQEICREIDTVTVKGSIKPMRLYTITIDYDDLEPTDDPLLHKSIKDKKSIRDKLRKELFNKLFSGSMTTWDEFSTDNDFIELRRFVNPDFEKTFSIAYKAYIRGDWHTAGTHLENLIKMRPHDGPTKNLYRIVVENHKKEKPENWKGYRELTSK